MSCPAHLKSCTWTYSIHLATPIGSRCPDCERTPVLSAVAGSDSALFGTDGEALCSVWL